MPRVQKIEPVWIGVGQELSGESTNCSKLTFVPPGGMQTGIDRQLAPTPSTPPPHTHIVLLHEKLSSSSYQFHVIVFPLVMLYVGVSLCIAPPEEALQREQVLSEVVWGTAMKLLMMPSIAFLLQ